MQHEWIVEDHIAHLRRLDFTPEEALLQIGVDVSHWRRKPTWTDATDFHVTAHKAIALQVYRHEFGREVRQAA